MIVQDTKDTDKKIADLRQKEAEELAVTLSARYGLPYLDLSKSAINTDALRLIPEPDAKRAGVAAFRSSGKHLGLAILSPHKNETIALIEDLKRKNYVLEIYMVSEISLETAWSRYSEISLSEKTKAGLIEISSDDIARLTEQFKTLADIKVELDKESAAAIARGGISGILEVILAGGLVTDASDIHLEPEQNAVRLRYRLDGVLQDVADFPLKIYTQLVSRLKLVSGMKLNIKQSSQDGRYSIALNDSEIEIRSSVIPSAYGESIVMRILNPKTIELTFEKLGVEPKLYGIFDREIRKPNGLVLLTGPTGSGKTTTLYAFLRAINSSENKVITIEDPIEYHLEGINQTQVNRKQNYTFLSGLRSALRQDPDVIMIGEIRDKETAQLAIQAALTGHLVFSTLHTNNAIGVIPRLIDMGVDPYLIAPTLALAMAQRLVRTLCEGGGKPIPVEDSIKIMLEKQFADLPENIRKKIPFGKEIYEAKPMPNCPSGVSGRTAVMEVIEMDKELESVILKNPVEEELYKVARAKGMLTMKEDAILKAFQRIIPFEEINTL